MRAPLSPGAPGSSAVYPPREDTLLLLEAAHRCRGHTVLEVGTGSGVVALAAARAGALRVVATDLHPEALRVLRRRATAERLRVEAVRTDLGRGLGRFGRVLSNPPYLPTRPVERDPDRWANLALDGGPDGCRVLARLLADLRSHLADHGRAYVIVSSLQDPRRLTQLRSSWVARGGEVRTVRERRFEGERLDLWELRADRASRGAPRTG